MSVSQEEVIVLYVATFNRAPDSAGLDYWVNDSGLSIEGIAQSFFDQEETQTLYPSGTSTNDFINAVYQNLFNRDADSDGLAYWANEIDSGNIIKSVFIEAVINGALDTDTSSDATILDNKEQVGLAFVEQGLSDTSLAASVMEDITADSSSVSDALSYIDSLASQDILDIVSDGNYQGSYSGDESGIVNINISGDDVYGTWYSYSWDETGYVTGTVDNVTGGMEFTSSDEDGVPITFTGIVSSDNTISGEWSMPIYGDGTFSATLL